MVKAKRFLIIVKDSCGWSDEAAACDEVIKEKIEELEDMEVEYIGEMGKWVIPNE